MTMTVKSKPVGLEDDALSNKAEIGYFESWDEYLPGFHQQKTSVALPLPRGYIRNRRGKAIVATAAGGVTGDRLMLLLDLTKPLEAAKPMMEFTGVTTRRARRRLHSAADLYPDLDIAAIEKRARELRQSATDSEAISRVLNQPVQVVHQAE